CALRLGLGLRPSWPAGPGAAGAHSGRAELRPGGVGLSVPAGTPASARRGGSAGSAAAAPAARAAMSSRPRREDAGPGGARRPREPAEQELLRRREQRRRRHDAQQLQQLKHLESLVIPKVPWDPGLQKKLKSLKYTLVHWTVWFLEDIKSPGAYQMLKKQEIINQDLNYSWLNVPLPSPWPEDETKPEDCILDVPGNEHAREFLAHAPTKELWMPLKKEVKVIQCEHGGGGKESPFFIKGNQKLEQFRAVSRTPPCQFTVIRD
ncbi:Retinitis pigmentosa 9 protein, partial [Galemys pyrenaicus]